MGEAVITVLMIFEALLLGLISTLFILGFIVSVTSLIDISESLKKIERRK